MDRFLPEDRVLGRGAHGVVRAALDTHTGTLVAVKTITPKSINHSSMIDTEVEILRIVDHPNIARFIAREDDKMGDVHIITELCDVELYNYIVLNGSFSEYESRPIVFQLLSAVLALKVQGIAHRDIKPENVGFAANGQLKLFDFGLARRHNGEKMRAVCGSTAYVSPEVLLGNYSGSSCDVWSIGVILYVLLCGFLPFDHARPQAALFDALDVETGVWRDMSIETKDFVVALLEKDPKDRLSVEDALSHSWFTTSNPNCQAASTPRTVQNKYCSPYPQTYRRVRRQSSDIDQEARLFKKIRLDPYEWCYSLAL
jgi:serine/threonine protein kinase